ncbi:MAG: ABC transporter substrate-binding protein [Xanthobacteraceae bacterium]
MGLRRLAPVCAGFAAVAAVSVTLAGSAVAAQTAVKVALEGSFLGPSAPFFVAQDRGYYRNARLDVAINAATDALNRVASGDAEFTVADINTVMKYRDQNPDAPIKAVFMIYNKPSYAIIARKSRGIAKPKDLEGKRLGAPDDDPVTALWPLFAKLNGIDVSKVKVENVAVAVREPILAAGQVDAVTGSALSTYISLKERGVPVADLLILPMGDYGMQLYGDAIVVNTKFASEKPAAVKAFLIAHVNALKSTIRDPVYAVNSLIKRNEAANKNIELERLRMAIEDNIVTDEVLENGFGAIDAARFANAIEQLGQTYKFKTMPAPPDVFDASFLPPAAQRQVGARPRRG